MHDCREVRTALRLARSKRDVGAIIAAFVASFSAHEVRAMPWSCVRGGAVSLGVDEIATAALDVKRKELRHRLDSPQLRTLEAVAAVLAAASARLAEFATPPGHVLRSMTTLAHRGTAERRIARRPDRP